MLRLLSWSGCDKLTSPDVKMFVSKKDSTSVTPFQPPQSTKRKRSIDDNIPSPETEHVSGDSGGISAASENVATLDSSKPTSTTHPGERSLPTPLLSPVETNMPRTDPINNVLQTENVMTKERKAQSLRQTIQSQISLEILLKHKELRLIDQELAKCQVALEQLRRCSEIPYPGTHLSQNVSNGNGAALKKSFPQPLPESPAPWGVTDGPYSRHYAQWLLPDSRFDGGWPEISAGTPGGVTPLSARSTRGHYVDVGQLSGKSSSRRSGQLKALPAGYGQPKEKASGPMILKRKSDGVMVKLVCPDCGRHDFGSAQGFINHCRIGHSRSFASHDAAAEACGEPIEYDESGAMVGVEPVVTPSTANVHPLIRSARLLHPQTPIVTPLHQVSRAKCSIPSAFQAVSDISPDFKPSLMTPHLSALVKNRGFGLDLQEMVTDAKTKIELPESDDEEIETETETEIPSHLGGRHPQVAGSKQPTTKSSISSPILSSRIRFPSNHPDQEQDKAAVADIRTDVTPHRILNDLHGETLPTLEPSPTSESNQAPSLVDDDEEFEPHSPTNSSVSDENEEGEIDFQVREDDENGTPILPTPEFPTSCATSTRPTSGHVRRPSAIRRQAGGREEKHVSFVSPSPARDLVEPQKGGDRKRRKLNG